MLTTGDGKGRYRYRRTENFDVVGFGGRLVGRRSEDLLLWTQSLAAVNQLPTDSKVFHS
jgi:hypothetical protein